MKRLTCIFFLVLSIPGWSQWVNFNPDTTSWNNSVAFLNKDTGFVASYYEDNNTYYGLILRTLNGGITWDTTHIPGIMILSVSFPSVAAAYCGGQDGAIYKTTDLGQTWFWYGNLPFSLDDYGSIYFLNADTGFVNDDSGNLIRTIDGGANWAVVSSIPSNNQNYFPGTGKFCFLDDSTGFVANGKAGKVLKTTDGGNNWTAIDLPNADWAMAIHMFNPDTGIVVCQEGKVYRTFNGGAAWIGPMLIGQSDLMDVDFFTDSVGYVMGGTDLYSVDFSNPPHPVPHGIIYRTNDAGNTWFKTDSFCCHWMTALDPVTRGIGYAVGWGGKILKITNAVGATTISELHSSSLLKVYPNPVRDELFLSLKCPFSYSIFNMVGQRVDSGIYQGGINAATLPEGMYFLQTPSGIIKFTKE